ncbi:restriction endonuclease subunit S [Streptomyces sp. 35M1]|uniref:restriction endonuclease subunit S n=1 Tax=Streptomyces sp. 35M1 TaxID=3142978 RepID=UPI0039907CD7
MGEWPRSRFDEVASADRWAFSIGPFGSKITANHYQDDGVPFIRGVNLARGSFFDDGFVFISREKADEVESANAMPGDLVFTRKGTVGQVAMIPRSPNYERYVISGSQVKARLDESRAVPEFYHYWFLSSQGQRSILAHAVTTGVPSLANSLASIRGLSVPRPSMGEQRAVAEVLGALDDKIALNERIAATARQLCRAFMQALWAEAGISSLTDWGAELRGGWRRTSLGKLCAEGAGSIQTGPFGSQLHASDYVQSGIPSVMPQNIGDNVISEDGIARISGTDADRLSKYLLAEGDIVYSRRGDVRRRALVRKHEAGWLCGTGCLRVRVGTSTHPLFMSYYLGEPEIQDWVAQHAVGATMPNLNTSILGELPVVLPPADVVGGVHERLAALDRTAAQVPHENRTLADLRDTLLPQLVTGKLRVKDAARVVEETV